MISLGFSASALTRVAVGMAFVAAACLLVWCIERPSPEIAKTASVSSNTTTATHSWPVTIESTYPVTTWSVSVLGVDQAPTRSDPFSWSGSLTATVGSELLVTATAASGDRAPNHGLRVAIGSATPQVVWSGGDVTATAEFAK